MHSRSRTSLASQAPNRTMRGCLLAVLAAAMTLLSGCAKTSEPLQATVLPNAVELPEFNLVDQDGNRFGRDDLRERWNLMFFGFTHCPDICPITLQQLAVARKRMSETRDDAKLPTIVFVSVDPERDDAGALRNYVEAFGAGVVGATAALEELDKLTKALGIFHARPPAADGGYSVEHSAAIVVINPRAEYHAVFSAPHDIDSLAHDLSLMVDAW